MHILGALKDFEGFEAQLGRHRFATVLLYLKDLRNKMYSHNSHAWVNSDLTFLRFISRKDRFPICQSGSDTRLNSCCIPCSNIHVSRGLNKVNMSDVTIGK